MKLAETPEEFFYELNYERLYSIKIPQNNLNPFKLIRISKGITIQEIACEIYKNDRSRKVSTLEQSYIRGFEEEYHTLSRAILEREPAKKIFILYLRSLNLTPDENNLVRHYVLLRNPKFDFASNSEKAVRRINQIPSPALAQPKPPSPPQKANPYSS